MDYSRRQLLAGVGTGLSVSLSGCSTSQKETEANNEKLAKKEQLATKYDSLVEMHTSSFRPETVTVMTGDTVVWYHVRGTTHTITAYQDRLPADAEYFASGVATTEEEARDRYGEYSPEIEHTPEGSAVQQGGGINSGGWYVHTFSVPGEYEYFCIPHESSEMTGTVIVEE